jgi:uncharacterized repeat protein (TIGR03843 family)
MPSNELNPESNIVHTLEHGEITIIGRMPHSSNATFLVSVQCGETSMQAIYKPLRGERPLWDFPDGTLADREYAAFRVSEFLGLDLVPLTILREGPYGIGMVQQWIDIDESID